VIFGTIASAISTHLLSPRRLDPVITGIPPEGEMPAPAGRARLPLGPDRFSHSP
jgi:hypothetical protein